MIRRPTRKSAQDARPKFLVLMLLGIFPLFLLELLRLPVVQAFESAASDARMQLRNTLDPRMITDTVRLVGVGEADEMRLAEDLDSRQSYTELLARLRRAKAAVATFDVFFIDSRGADDFLALGLGVRDVPTILAYYFKSRRDELAPPGDVPEDFRAIDEMVRQGSDPEELRGTARDLGDYLAALQVTGNEQRKAGVDAAGRRELLTMLGWTRALRDDAMRRWLWLTRGADPKPELPPGDPFTAADMRVLSPGLMMASASHGFTNVEKAGEDVVRRAPLVYRWKDRLFPGLSLATALEFYDVRWQDVEVRFGDAIYFRPKRSLGDLIRIPIDQRGLYLVNFREGESFLERQPLLSAALHPDYPDYQFANRIVLVGEVLSGGFATDLEPIPLQDRFPMVGLHANILDNILRQDFITEPSPLARLGLGLFLGTTSALLFYFLSFGAAARATGLLLLLFLMVQYLVFQRYGLALPIVKPAAGLMLASLLFFGYVVIVKDKDRRLVRDVFMKSVSPRIGEEILKNFDDPAIWGARREITVLFVDVRGYTTMSEEQGPAAVLDLLETFYDTVSEAVFRHEGQVNKFLGDAVLALFGALPEEPPNHAERALLAAIEIQKAVHQLNEVATDTGSERLRMNTGAGINSGIATVGLVGRRRIRIEYTALGDPVNVASRLQGQASEGEIVLGEATMDMLGGPRSIFVRSQQVHVSAAEALTLKGKKVPIQAFKLTLLRDDGSPISRVSSEKTPTI